MGLSLSVLVALVLLLPGAAFVFAATRLHSATAPSTGLEQQLSLSLAVAPVAAIVGHLMSLAALQVTSAIWTGIHLPDLHAVVQLLSGNTTAAATATSQALSEHPFCAGSYILATAGLMWGVGRYANRYIQAREQVDWYHLLRPAAATNVVPPRVVKRVRPATSFSRCPPCAGIVLEKVRRGREDVFAGRLYTTEECRRRLGRWLDERRWEA